MCPRAQQLLSTIPDGILVLVPGSTVVDVCTCAAHNLIVHCAILITINILHANPMHIYIP